MSKFVLNSKSCISKMFKIKFEKIIYNHILKQICILKTSTKVKPITINLLYWYNPRKFE